MGSERDDNRTFDDLILQSIAAGSEDSIMLLDREYSIQWISKTALGLTVEQVLGTRVYDYVPESQHRSMRAAYARAAETGRPDRYDTVYRNGDHVSFWEARISPLMRDSEVSGFVVIASDVTEYRATALQRDRFFALSPDLLCVTRMDGRILEVNRAFTDTLGYPSAAVEGAPLYSFVHPADVGGVRAALDNLGDGREITTFEARCTHRDGSHRLLEWRATPDRETERVLAIGRDVTERRALHDQLLQSQKMEAIGQLAGGVAHDFNNLLLSILANSGFAREAAGGDAQMIEYLQYIDEAAHRSAELTKQLLAISRRQTMEMKSLDLGELISNLMKLLRRLIPENIEVEVMPGHGLSRVHGDRAQLEQVMMNLALNARDAMPNGGKLRIEASDLLVDDAYRDAHPWLEVGHFVRLSVSDDGEGMSKEVQARIFEPFFTTKPPFTGTGLGLATAYGVIQQHGGFVHVQSEQGRGTTMQVYLPATQRPEPESPGERPAREAAPGGGRTILIAEDEKLVRRVVKRLLERHGYRVLVAEDGAEAVRIYEERRAEIDLVLLDVVMPSLGGPEAYARMQAQDADLPVLFCSGYASPRTGSGVPLSEHDVLEKPYRSSELLDRISALLGGRAASAD